MSKKEHWSKNVKSTWHQFNIGDSIFIHPNDLNNQKPKKNKGFVKCKLVSITATIGGESENVIFNVSRKGVVSQMPFDKSKLFYDRETSRYLLM